MLKNLLLLPLDERPCNNLFPGKIFEGEALHIEKPEKLGNKKEPADSEAIHKFLVNHAADADAAVISMDMLLYGGLIPSRLHHIDRATVEKRLHYLDELKSANPKIKIYAFQCIMRCPSYSSSDEEPDYYENCGKEINQLGQIIHKNELFPDEKKDTSALIEKIGKDNIDDYLNRREFNLSFNIETLDLLEKGIIDFLVIPQDDSAEFGFTAVDQKKVRAQIQEKLLDDQVFLYPGADEVSMTLIARAVNEMNGKVPKIYLKYASEKAKTLIPNYEDRSLGETLKYHILAAGCTETDDSENADFILIVTAPANKMLESAVQPANNINYDVERNMAEIYVYIEQKIKEGKNVAVLDNAYTNGGEIQLFKMLNKRDLLLKIIAYAGWNTSANSLGTVLAESVNYLYNGRTEKWYDFMVERYLEDIGYDSTIRSDITRNYLPQLGMSYFWVEEKRGIVANEIKSRLEKFAGDYMTSLKGHVEIKDVYMPWSRMFEIGIEAGYIKKGDVI
jgi:hypothetical protein